MLRLLHVQPLWSACCHPVANNTDLFFGIWRSNFSLRVICHVSIDSSLTTGTNPIGNLQQTTGRDTVTETKLCIVLWRAVVLSMDHACYLHNTFILKPGNSLSPQHTIPNAVVWELGLNLGVETDYTDKDFFCGFPLLLQATLGHKCCSRFPFQIDIHISSYYFTLHNLRHLIE